MLVPEREDRMIAERIARVKESGTMKMKELAGQKKAEGKEIISFSVGEPDFDTPKHIVEAAKKALDEGKTRYLNAAGLPELREAIAKASKANNAIPCDASNVMVTPTKHAMFETIMATVNEGEEVIMPTAALARIEFRVDSWSEALESRQGRLAGHWLPKEL